MPFLISLIAALLILSSNSFDTPLAGSKLGGAVMAAIGFFLALAALFQFEKVLVLLQKAENAISTRIIELFRKDSQLNLLQWVIFAVSFFSIALGAYLVFSLKELPVFGLSIWILAIGLGFSCWRRFQKRFTHYLDPYEVKNLYVTASRKSIRAHDEKDLCNWLDALSEVGVKAASKSSGALSANVVNEFPGLTKHFLDSCKTVFFQNQDKDLQKMGIQDKVSYTLFFIYQRLEQIQDKALQNRLEALITIIITSLGKISLYGAEYDLSLASYPLHLIGKFSLQAQKIGMKEVGVKAGLTLVEVARLLLTEIDLTFGDLKDPFLSLIKNLETIEKESFRLDKTTEIHLLKAPFLRIRSFFDSEKAKNLKDAPLILNDLDRVLGEFEALEVILKTLPPIPEVPEEKMKPVTSTPDLNLPGMTKEAGISPPPLQP